jgi:CRISPR/Cas system CSM-associated protein Csm5 (group 7 of RAMP superfamily)
MDILNRKYNIEITVLSPLAIGAGMEKDLVKGIDYVVEKGNIFLLNMKKLVENGINPQELTSFYATKNSTGLIHKIGGKLNAVSDIVMVLPANSDNDIKTFIKNELSGKPIIPGSSLKGAVRSVILEYLLNNAKPIFLKEKDYFGDSKKGDELMRFIKFSDTEFDKTALVNTKIFNLHKPEKEWLGGWKHSGNTTNGSYQANGFNTLYESIMPEEKGICSIMLSDSKIFEEKNSLYKTNKEKLLSIEGLFAIINKHTKDYIEKELKFFSKYPTQNSDKIIENLNVIMSKIPSDNSICILKMSAGSGFHSITGDWQYEDFTAVGNWTETDSVNKKCHARAVGKHKYKSRKVAINGEAFSLMGFVKLRRLDDDDLAQIEKEKAGQKIREAERRRAEYEEREKDKDKTRIELENKANYDKLLIKALHLFEDNKAGDALKAIEEAILLMPKQIRHIELQTKIEASLKIKEKAQQLEMDIKLAALKAEDDRREANKVPLKVKISNVWKVQTMLGNVKTWMKLNGIEELSADEISVVYSQLKTIFGSMKERDKKEWSNYKKWKEISGLAGNEMSQELFKELFEANSSD